MDADGKRKGRRCPPFRLQRTSPHFHHTYASECTSHALIMRFSAKVEKPMKGRAGRASKKPYALYAPLLGVGVFSAFFLLRAYGRIRKSLESGLSPTARRHWSLFGPRKRKVHTDFRRFSSESPADEIDSPPPVFDSARRACRLLPLYAILWPL